MTNRKRQTVRGIVVFLAVFLQGNALADGDNESIADVNGEKPELIEEIVVIGGKKNHRPKRTQDSLDEFATPSHVEWQLLPAYDHERALQRLKLIPLGDPIRRVGIVEVFRISFGR